MKKILISLLFFTLWGYALYAQNEQEKIKQVVMEAYVSGIHNSGPLENITAGFHPGFELLGIGSDGNTITKLPIYTWIENIKQSRAAGRVAAVETKCRFLSIDITGNAAVVKLELLREEKLIFTDYLFLYNFTEGWKIVNKIYHRH